MRPPVRWMRSLSVWFRRLWTEPQRVAPFWSSLTVSAPYRRPISSVSWAMDVLLRLGRTLQRTYLHSECLKPVMFNVCFIIYVFKGWNTPGITEQRRAVCRTYKETTIRWSQIKYCITEHISLPVILNLFLSEVIYILNCFKDKFLFGLLP